MSLFSLPDLGEGLTEAEVVAWRVSVGDTVSVDQPVVEVETAKAVVEVPVPFAGQVAELHAQPGDVVPVGAPLISIAAGAEVSEADPASGSVLVGYGTTAPGRRRRRARGLPVPSRSPDIAGPADAPPATPVQQPAPANVAVVSPLVRRLASQAGIDVTAVAGTGTDGLITRGDVERAIQAASSAAPAARAPGAQHAGARRIPLRGARKVMADKLSRSRREIPEATVWVDADATQLLAVRAELNARVDADPALPRISLLALLSRFAILGLARYPELNARIEDEQIVIDSAVHLGFAAQTERGLVVPVIPNAQALSVEQLAVALAERTQRGRAGTLAPAELTGGTFTINNYGVFGVDGSAAIINHPEVAILGIGRILERPWAVAGQVTVRSIVQLTLAFDHRACDGGTAGGFLRYVADCVEAPTRLLRQL